MEEFPLSLGSADDHSSTQDACQKGLWAQLAKKNLGLLLIFGPALLDSPTNTAGAPINLLPSLLLSLTSLLISGFVLPEGSCICFVCTCSVPLLHGEGGWQVYKPAESCPVALHLIKIPEGCKEQECCVAPAVFQQTLRSMKGQAV